MNRTAIELVFPMPGAQMSPFGVARAKIPSTTADYTTVPVFELIRACVDGEAPAWQEFIRRFHRIIAVTSYRTARRWGEGSPAVVDDLTQETYVKVCADRSRVLREFDSENPDAIFAFLKVVTTNVANDYFKRLHARKRGGCQPSESLENVERTGSAGGPASPGDLERSVLLNQVDACLSEVAPAATRERDRTIFWLYYRQGLTAEEIANLPSLGLSTKGVESMLHRLAQLVRARLAQSRRGKTYEKGV